ncbi:hypothetical protein [Tahibacter sp.]|uniref:hypothetical protein n=1 Tax=Tahibacter sp. TaxID=2056211 RepID=UPI0028C3A903|nr:hypothetical protein [Tahibacter sp.]
MTTSTVLHPLPSRAQLIKATAIAAAAAGLILVIAVLPAEHGIDPTGIGRKLGLLGMSTGATTPDPVLTKAPPAAPATAAPSMPTPVSTAVRNEFVTQSDTTFRSGEMQVTLGPDKGAEIKAKMHKGEQFTFTWATGAGPVEFDMHGEETNAAKDVFTSYWKGDAASGAGTFTAPFDGSHGWYWHNHGTEPVTVTVTVSGFYRELYRP